MAVQSVDVGQQLLVYIVILVAVPLAFVLLLRAKDYFAIDDVSDHHTQGDWQTYGDQPFDDDPAGPQTTDDATDSQRDEQHGSDPSANDVPSDWVPCPRCGTRNGPDYTFCRSCVARISV